MWTVKKYYLVLFKYSRHARAVRRRRSSYVPIASWLSHSLLFGVAWEWIKRIMLKRLNFMGIFLWDRYVIYSSSLP